MFACMGLYPQIPGVGGFAVNTPIFSDIKIHLAGDANRTIHIVGGSEKNIYITGMKLNGVDHNCSWLDWSDLENGATVSYSTSSKPDKNWGSKQLPPSYD